MSSRLEYLLHSSPPSLPSNTLCEESGIANLEVIEAIHEPASTIVRVVEIGNLVNVNYLSGLLGISPMQIVNDLTELGRRPGACQTLTYELAALVATRHGYYPVKVG